MIDLGGNAVVFACSHRGGGNSDAAAELMARGLRESGVAAGVVPLRDYKVLHCLACRACAGDTLSRCVLRQKDQTEALFAMLLHAPAVCFAVPIYFYGLPSLLKTWVDRSQRIWEARRKGEPWLLELGRRPVRVCFVAGQPTGEKLFEGARLSMKYFLANFGLDMQEPLCLRGVDAAGDLLSDASATQAALSLGHAAGKAARHG